VMVECCCKWIRSDLDSLMWSTQLFCCLCRCMLVRLYM